jgi:hypothetical protein
MPDQLCIGCFLAIVLTLEGEAESIWPNTIYKALRSLQIGGISGAGFLVSTNATSDSMRMLPPKVLDRLKECLNLREDVQPRWFKI